MDPPVLTPRPVTISVIVATYGDVHPWKALAKHRAIPSVCAQTVQPLELIREHGETLHGARNDAAARAQGAWVCFLDADDALDPGYLAAMTQAARVEQTTETGEAVKPCALLAPAVAYVRDGHAEEPRILDPGVPMTEVNRCVIGTLVPRWLFEAIGGFRDWPMSEDWDAFLSCLEHGAEVVPVPDAVYRAWETPGSRNRQGYDVAIATYDAIRAAHGLPVPRRRRAGRTSPQFS